MATRELSDRWAYDIDKEPTRVGEIWDVDVINQSIEMILGTSRGERIFIPNFGSGLPNRIFNSTTPEEAESLLDELIDDIRRWEDRIVVQSDLARIIVSTDANSIILVIPYQIKRNGIQSVFKKKIVG